MDTAAVDRWCALALGRAMGHAVPAPDTVPLAALPRDAIGARLRFHGIAGLLAADAAAMADLPAWLADLIAAEAQMQRVWEHTHRQALLPVLEQCAAADIPVLVLKGTALAYDLYPDPAMRARGDSDLLVPPDRVADVRRILVAQGFSHRAGPGFSTHEEDWWTDSGFGLRHEIDLHWRAVRSTAMEAIVLAAGPFAATRPLPQLSPAAQAPSLVHTFLQAHINQFAHAANGYVLDGAFVAGAGRLGWVVDEHLMARAFSPDDWRLLASVSLATGIAPSIAANLRRAQALLGADIPAHVLAQLDRQQQPDTANRYFDYSAPATRLLMDLRAARGWRQVLAQAQYHLLPTRARIMTMHPDYPDWPLALLQLRRLCRLAVRKRPGRSHAA